MRITQIYRLPITGTALATNPLVGDEKDPVRPLDDILDRAIPRQLAPNPPENDPAPVAQHKWRALEYDLERDEVLIELEAEPLFHEALARYLTEHTKDELYRMHGAERLRKPFRGG